MRKGAKGGKVRPMLATLVDRPFDREGWLFEMKWDGYRAIAHVARERRGAPVSLYSRNQIRFDQYPAVEKALSKMKHDAILDGEVVVLDAKGHSSFQLLQNYHETGEGPLTYCVFDILELDGEDLRDKSLIERKAILKKILPKAKALHYSDHVEIEGRDLFNLAQRENLEGIMAKDGKSPYRENIRGREWLKIKTHQRQEVVVVGFTEPTRSREMLGALVAAVYDDNGTLTYIGHVGGGFNRGSLEQAYKKLKRIERKASPFQEEIATNTPVHWVKPILVAEVKFAEWTSDGHLRQPIFVGWRKDKPAKDVVRERPADEGPKLKKPEPKKKGTYGHLDKVFWPKEGWTKGDMMAYYRDVADVILPYLKDRPVSLNRHPNGIEGESFFQKDIAEMELPPFMKTTIIRSESAGKIVAPMCQNAKSLEFLAHLGCIEMNAWNSRVRSLKKPDYLIFDLDPEGIAFKRVVETALKLHALLEDLGVANVCKTSGGRGLHVYVPLGAKYTHEEARDFTTLIAQIVHGKLPKTTSLERLPGNRQGRVYFDFLQNKHGATNVAPYSLRPRPGAPVGMPLKWAEVKPGLDPLDFNLKTARKRIDKVGDLFAPVLGKGIDMAGVLKEIEKRGIMET